MVLAAIALAGVLDYLLVFRKKTPLSWKRVWLLLRVVAGMVGPLQLRSFLYSELYLAAKGNGIRYVQGLHSLLPAYQRYWVVGTVVWIVAATAIAWRAVIRKERRPMLLVLVLMALNLIVAAVYGRYHASSLLNLESYILMLALLQNGFLLYPVYGYDERAEKSPKVSLPHLELERRQRERHVRRNSPRAGRILQDAVICAGNTEHSKKERHGNPHAVPFYTECPFQRATSSFLTACSSPFTVSRYISTSCWITL